MPGTEARVAMARGVQEDRVPQGRVQPKSKHAHRTGRSHSTPGLRLQRLLPRRGDGAVRESRRFWSTLSNSVPLAQTALGRSTLVWVPDPEGSVTTL